jgi:hypothetical protein
MVPALIFAREYHGFYRYCTEQLLKHYPIAQQARLLLEQNIYALVGKVHVLAVCEYMPHAIIHGSFEKGPPAHANETDGPLQQEKTSLKLSLFGRKRQVRYFLGVPYPLQLYHGPLKFDLVPLALVIAAQNRYLIITPPVYPL